MTPVTDEQTFADLAWFHRFTLEPDATLDQAESDQIEARRYGRDADLATIVRRLDLILEDPNSQGAAIRSKIYGIAGNTWLFLPTGDRGTNIQKAIEHQNVSLQFRTLEEHPVEWARTQNNLGLAWSELLTGDRGANIENAIECYKAALQVHTREHYPVKWAATNNNLGGAWWKLPAGPTGDRGANIESAIECYKATLQVYTRKHHSIEWAKTYNNLGAAWLDLPTGKRGANIQKAIHCFEAALQVRTRKQYPVDWATTKNNLGGAWGQLSTGDRRANIQKAIDCFKAALQVRTRTHHPVSYAKTTANLGVMQAEANKLGQDLGNPVASWKAAMEAFEAAGAGLMAEQIHGWIVDWEVGGAGDAEGGGSPA
ncbi:MAG: hypothetical protein AAF750_01495 [Planctomycetota bacterium]